VVVAQQQATNVYFFGCQAFIAGQAFGVLLHGSVRIMGIDFGTVAKKRYASLNFSRSSDLAVVAPLEHYRKMTARTCARALPSQRVKV
jgi:hypothetical protein